MYRDKQRRWGFWGSKKSTSTTEERRPLVKQETTTSSFGHGVNNNQGNSRQQQQVKFNEDVSKAKFIEQKEYKADLKQNPKTWQKNSSNNRYGNEWVVDKNVNRPVIYMSAIENDYDSRPDSTKDHKAKTKYMSDRIDNERLVNNAIIYEDRPGFVTKGELIEVNDKNKSIHSNYSSNTSNLKDPVRKQQQQVKESKVEENYKQKNGYGITQKQNEEAKKKASLDKKMENYNRDTPEERNRKLSEAAKISFEDAEKQKAEKKKPPKKSTPFWSSEYLPGTSEQEKKKQDKATEKQVEEHKKVYFEKEANDKHKKDWEEHKIKKPPENKKVVTSNEGITTEHEDATKQRQKNAKKINEIKESNKATSKQVKGGGNTMSGNTMTQVVNKTHDIDTIDDSGNVVGALGGLKYLPLVMAGAGTAGGVAAYELSKSDDKMDDEGNIIPDVWESDDETTIDNTYIPDLTNPTGFNDNAEDIPMSIDKEEKPPINNPNVIPSTNNSGTASFDIHGNWLQQSNKIDENKSSLLIPNTSLNPGIRFKERYVMAQRMVHNRYSPYGNNTLLKRIDYGIETERIQLGYRKSLH